MAQFYGMPVAAYERYYIGLLWIFRHGSSDLVRQYNHDVALMDAQLAYSFDGVRFQRGVRESFIQLNEPGEPGSGMLEPSCMVDTGEEIRIYSAAGKHSHGMSRQFRGRSDGMITVEQHSLRKDGFMYVGSAGGSQGTFLSKPLVLHTDELKVNAQAPHGEVLFQITDVRSEPLEGFTFEDSVPFCEQDELFWRVNWKNRSLVELVGKPIRLACRLRHARIYAFRSDFHFLDAQDWHMLEDGHSIDTRWFDF